ncbi:histone-lysine N-methyltransferase NSD3-like isoform X2 [Betta splendens]|uniref:Histone-lysine N-methyltransferase NSD3-like isoform X2 n=1 Tax=Betta splendens TaxID=158456 RepID=A0A6P7NXL0_BETSP|nr:histone-lysine N-methyltransferase NSD3-like isoform X2 [Betta splendens]
MEMQKKQQTPEQDALEHIVSCRDKPFLEERLIDSFKGRGVFTQQAIEPSTFVVEYRGKISRLKTRKSRRKHEDTLNNYLYEFYWKGTHWCIDASKEDKTLGRIVNDDHINPNCEMKKVEFEGTPHLCLFALREISLGEEITFNYGTSSYPWRSKLVAASCSDEEELGDPKSKRVSDGNYEPEQAALISDGDYKPEEAGSSSDVHGSDNDCDNKDTEEPKAVHQSRRNYCYVCGKDILEPASPKSDDGAENERQGLFPEWSETFPKVLVLPVPVPVYVPVPMNMYSQCTPQPVGLPLPLPVPLFLPVTRDSAESIVDTIQEIKEKIPSDRFE